MTTREFSFVTILSGALAILPMTLLAQEPPTPPPPPAPARAAAPEAPVRPAAPARAPRARWTLDESPMPALAPVAPRDWTPAPEAPFAVGWPDDPPTPPPAPWPALAPFAPLPPLERDFAPLPALAPMPPTPPAAPVALGWQDVEMASPRLYAWMPEPQDDESRRAADKAREQADKVREEMQRVREKSRAKSADDAYYGRGSQYLDRRDYDKAIDNFNRVIENKGERADGALYWRAYAQNKLGKRQEARASIAELQKSYPQSRWIEDAKALDIEVQQSSGQSVSPDNVSDEELKVEILRHICDSDSERCIPALEKLVKGSSSPRLKQNALFVLAQSRSPKARDLLAQIAKGSTNPDVQLKAIEYLGVHSSSENQQLLSDVYRTSNDTAVKRAILRSFMISQNRAALLAAAKNEQNPELRMEAIRQLGVMGGAAELYPTENTYEGKREIIRGLMVGGDSAKLAEIAKSEKDPKLRTEAIRQLGVMSRSKTGDTLSSMYRSETDKDAKHAIMNGLFIQQNDHALIEIARSESDPEMRRDVIRYLANIRSKEATDYLMEILNK